MTAFGPGKQSERSAQSGDAPDQPGPGGSGPSGSGGSGSGRPGRSDSGNSTASSLRAGLRLVDAVINRERSGRTGFNVSRLADEMGLERSKASRMTQELCDKGFLERREDSTLRAAHEFFALAASLNPGLLHSSRAILRRLAIRHGASARLSVRDGVLVRLLRAESSPGMADQWMTRTTLVTPCWCTGAGRALLWDHTKEEIAMLLVGYELIGVGGPNASRSAAEVARANARDAPGGLVTAHGEFEHGITEYAAPVRDAQGRVFAAIAVLGRQNDLAPREELVRTDLTAAAAELGNLS
ncbi:transcriptional regulator [Streptomyces sp. NBC_00264]|uniref:IclR family transcriptional regulator n=1 Tax=unclassified Streptomyces TaxID=2593676 RepID=UPI002258D492|nr:MULTISPECIES: IclR family transcriptional regulator C-terminal domain-containing protein [unclassified Streptomyces]MCX5165378.1 transcriptional regulator [Streptomyces sp. NBC_00305]MCX5223902.1 transcriptional regulator [Streptomyces sp. NBC_00264]